VLGAFEEDAKTAVVLMTDDSVVAVLAVADTIRPQSAAAVDALGRAGVHVVMLTGDNVHTARAVAARSASTRSTATSSPTTSCGSCASSPLAAPSR
jgi:P-type E1-E2 ATPase